MPDHPATSIIPSRGHGVICDHLRDHSFVKERTTYMKCAAAISLAVTLLALMPAVCHAQEFSAEVVYAPVLKDQDPPASGTTVPPVPSAKLYVSKDRMRFESGGLTGLIMIVDVAKQTAVALFPSQKSYRQLGSRPSVYFRVTDAENACPDWQKAVGKEITCEKVGDDVVGGRKTVKYRSPTPNSGNDYIWIDSKLNYVIKWHVEKTDAELRHIAEGPQSADLFAIPQGYEPRKPPRKQSRTTPRPR